MATTTVNGKRGRGGLQVPTPPQGYLNFTSQSSQTVRSSLRLARSSLGGLARKGEMDGWMGGEWKDRALDGRPKIKCESARQLCLPCKRTEQTGGGGSEEGGDHSHHRHHHHDGTTPTSHRPSRLSLRVASVDSTERTPRTGRAREMGKEGEKRRGQRPDRDGQERGPGGDVYDFFCLWCVDRVPAASSFLCASNLHPLSVRGSGPS